MFDLPEDLAPEIYPLAWLVGAWHGDGVLKYPKIPERAFTQDVVFEHDGGPYLRYTSVIRVAVAPDAGPGAGAQPPAVWSSETGFWRVSTDRPAGLGADQHPVEVLLADAAGRVSVYLGAVGGGRVDLASDLIARTATGADVTASKRLYGSVEGKLMWVWELAAFGQPLQSYASASLDRAARSATA